MRDELDDTQAHSMMGPVKIVNDVPRIRIIKLESNKKSYDMTINKRAFLFLGFGCSFTAARAYKVKPFRHITECDLMRRRQLKLINDQCGCERSST